MTYTWKRRGLRARVLARAIAAVAVIAATTVGAGGIAAATVHTSAGASAFDLWEVDADFADDPSRPGGDFGSLGDRDVCGTGHGGTDDIHRNSDKVGDFATTTGSSSDKVDLCATDATSFIDDSGNLWAVVGWETVEGRCSTANGAVLFHFRQSTNTTTTGDIIFRLPYKDAAEVYRYNGSRWVGATVSTSTVFWAWDDEACTGEIAVNLSALDVFSTAIDSCVTFVSYSVHTQNSGSGFSSSLEDFAGPYTASITSCPDIRLTKTDDAESVAPGTTGHTYVITAINEGAGTATTAPLTEYLPDGFTVTSWTCEITRDGAAPGTDACGIESGATITSGSPFTTLTLEPGGVATITITGDVARTSSGTLRNVAIVDDGSEDQGLGDRAEDTTAVLTPNLGLAKIAVDCGSDEPIDIVTAGASICFDLSVTNTDDGTAPDEAPALDVRLTDALPNDAGLGWSVVAVSATGDAAEPTCSIADGILTCGGEGYDLPVGGGFTVRITSPTSVATVADSPVQNTAVASAINDDSITAGDEIAVEASDLEITKTDGSGTYTPGAPITYTITAWNNGPSSVNSATITDEVPAAITDVMWTCTGSNGAECGIASGAGNSISTTASIPADPTPGVDPGDRPTVVITVNGTVAVDATGVITNTATIAAGEGEPADVVPDNNSSTDEDVAHPVADLTVVKTTAHTVAIPGDGVEYSFSIVVGNNGPSPASAVELTDPTPAGLIWVRNEGGCGAGFPCDLGTLQPGETRTITVMYLVPAGYLADGNPAAIRNVATATSPDDPTPASDEAALPTESRVDLAITKDDGSATYLPGGSQAYTLTVTNAGPSDAVDARILDTLPAGLLNATWNCAAEGGAACGTASGTGDVDLTADLPAGASVIITVNVDVDTALAGTLRNTASVTPGTETDTDPSNNSDDDVNLRAAADLNLTKTGPDTVVPGETVAFTITVTNEGPASAREVEVADPTPAGLIWLDTDGACTTAFPCMLGELAAGTTAMITATFRVPADYVAAGGAQPIVNTATATSPDDPTPAQDEHRVTPTPKVDVSITKDDGEATYLPGGTIAYTLTVTNAGPSDAVGAVITDQLPEGLTEARWTCAAADGATCGTGEGDGDVHLPANLPAGSTVTVVVTATVSADLTGELVNIARVAPVEEDTEPGNNFDDDTDTRRPTELEVTKTGPSTVLVGGEDVTFTITVRNTGGAPARDVTIEDPTPAGLTLVRIEGAGCESFPCLLGTLADGAERTISATYSVPADYLVGGGADPIVNTARATSPDDPTPDEDDHRVTPTERVDLELTKRAVRGDGTLGTTIDWAITVTNRGPSAAAAPILVVDELPLGTSFAGASGPFTCEEFEPGLVGCVLDGHLPTGETRELVITTLVEATASEYTNVAVVEAGNASLDPDSPTPDPTPENNVDGDSVEAPIAPVPTSVAPATTFRADPTTTVVPTKVLREVQDRPAPLAFTGGALLPLLAGAGSAIAVGALLVGARRRRN